MGFLKNVNIKNATKIRTTQILHGIIEIQKNNDGIPPKEALVAYIKKVSDCESISPAYPDLDCSLYDIFMEFLNDIDADGKADWQVVLRSWVARIVFNELSYDKTIGTQQDFQLVSKVFYDLINKPLDQKLVSRLRAKNIL